MGKASREKGKRWEREVARLYRESVGAGKRTGWHQSHGLEVADVSVPMRVGKWTGVWNECKHGKKVNHRAALAQALEVCPPSQLPIAVCKDDRTEALVVLRLADWLELLAAVSREEKEAA